MTDADNAIPRSNVKLNKGVKDQYADGKAAKVWDFLIGDIQKRTKTYQEFLINLLTENGCRRILDVACGTGVDSIMLLEAGFEVVSVDGSDQMLKYALKERWNRRSEQIFYNWIIEEANWLSVDKDINHLLGDGFDAVICIGNSYAHILDELGDKREQKLAIENFHKCLKPGGILLIDHRNYDNIIESGAAPTKCYYYDGTYTPDVKTTVTYASGKPSVVTLDYTVDTGSSVDEFKFSFYPHKLEDFTNIVKSIFGAKANHHIYGDFKSLDIFPNPDFYMHVIEKMKL